MRTRGRSALLALAFAVSSVACGLEVVGTFDTKEGASATLDGGGRDAASSSEGGIVPAGDAGGSDAESCTGAACPCDVDAGACPEAGTPVTLTVVVNGTTTPGSVTALAQGLSCPGGLCAATVAAGTTVQLAAHPLPDQTLVSWSLPACGRSLACSVQVDGPLTVVATFADLQQYTHSTDKLYPVNGVTGALGSPISFQTCGGGSMLDIAIDRAGNAFAVNGANLMKLNLQTATCSPPLGPLGATCPGLTFMPDPAAPSKDVLVAACGKSIYRLDTKDASKTLIGNLDGDWSISGDLVYIPEQGLYATVTQGGKDSIAKLDPTTAAMLATKSTGLDDLFGLGWRGDAMLAYGIDAVYSIDLATGTPTLLNPNTTINAWGGATGP